MTKLLKQIFLDKDVFGNFTSFQGFVEQMYNCIMDPDKGGAWNKYLFADETLNNYPYNFDNGNYWGNETYFLWSINQHYQAIQQGTEESGNMPGMASVSPTWPWRKLKNLVFLKVLKKRRILLKGRPCFSEDGFISRYAVSGEECLYVTRVLKADENLVSDEFNRLNFQETAKKMAEDFRAAADLLPNHWDQSVIGQKTLGS